MWFVVRDPSNNQFFRMPDPAYQFIGLLDGRRTVDEAWELCGGQLGDAAPTQGEAIQLLGQLYTSNLLQADLPADTASMFERHRKRVRREVGGYMTNLLFVRIPLFDPDRILERWVGVFGWLFSWIGLVLWFIVVSTGFYFLMGHWGQLVEKVQQQEFFATENLMILYLSFAAIKAIHEFAHGFACKRFGRDTHTGGEVHTIGIMFLVFMPVPYVDASSSWAFRSKWQRAGVGAAGIFAELAVASVAAVVWANTSADHLANAIAYNLIFIASVSTLIFNGNPLLRFDGYYILSDLLEIPNLQHRSKEYLYYLVRKYVFGARRAQHPSQSAKEKSWLLFFVIASTIYRVFISVRILLFVADKLFFVGALLAMMALVSWLFVPLGKFVRYLATKEELSRTRGRAVTATLAFATLIAVTIGAIQMPDYGHAEGFVEPRQLAEVYVESDGFVEHVEPSGVRVQRGGEPLLVAHNVELAAQRNQLLAERRIEEANLRLSAQSDEVVTIQMLLGRIEALDAQIRRINERIAKLKLKPSTHGLWIAPDIDHSPGAYLRQGDKVGMIASVEDLLVRITADQYLGPRIAPEMGLGAQVDLRVKGRPDIGFTGTIRKILPAGQERLPSRALGYLVGGSMAVDLEDPEYQRSAQPFFEVQIDPNPNQAVLPTLLSGQRVIARFEMPKKPLAVQWWRQIRQLVQRRFQA